MYSFHVTIHARPADAAPGPTLTLDGRQVATLHVPQESLAAPFALSFEEASERLATLPRLFIEPDGSFFWGSPHDGPRWQLDGNLSDRDGRLLIVDLKGTCPPEELDCLLSALGWPETELVFQFVRHAVVLDESEFRRWAAREF